MRLTKKDFNYNAPILHKLGQLEDLMEKYNFESIEELDDFLKCNVIYGKWRDNKL